MRSLNRNLISALLLSSSQVFPSSAALGHEFQTCDGGAILTSPFSPITLRVTSDQFPPGDAFTDALGEVVQGWSNTACAKDFACDYENPSENANAFPNAVNEVYWTVDGTESTEGSSWVGLCIIEYSEITCQIMESDILFNDLLVDFTASTNVADVPDFHGGAGSMFSFQTVAYHEFGHALGLDHTPDVYSVMGQSPHHHVNGSLAIAYPGEDAISGAVELYGAVPGGFHDLALAPFKFGGGNEGGYAIIAKNEIEFYDNGPGLWENGDVYEVVPGMKVQMEVTVENFGTSMHSTSIRYYVSSDANITTGDVYLGEHIADVYPDQPHTVLGPVLTLPNNLTVGQDYWLGAVIDPNNNIAEASEWNNRMYIPIRVEAWKPDLKALSISGPATITAGGSNAFVTSNFSNVGGPIAGGTVGYEVQIVPDDFEGPAQFGGITLASKSGAPGFHLDVVSIPDDLAPGAYHWALEVAHQAGGEGDDLGEEPNFILGGAVTVQAGPTELVAAAVSGPAYGGSQYDLEAGDPVAVQFTVDNLGNPLAHPVLYHVVLSLNDDIAPSDWLVASGELYNAGTFDVIGSFPDLPHAGTYHWGLIVTNAGYGDDPSNNVLLGGDILVVEQGIFVNEFVSGPASASAGSLAAVSFQFDSAGGPSHTFEVRLMTAAQVNKTSKTSSLVVASGSYNGGSIHTKALLPKSLPAGTYYWAAVLKSGGPFSHEKVVIGNAVSVGGTISFGG